MTLRQEQAAILIVVGLLLVFIGYELRSYEVAAKENSDKFQQQYAKDDFMYNISGNYKIQGGIQNANS